MPTENANPEAILEAIKKIEIVSELLEEKNKNNLKMIVEGKVSGGKQIGPYARLLTYAPGEVIIREGEWGGNTFYLSVEGDLHVPGEVSRVCAQAFLFRQKFWRLLIGS